MNLTLRHVDDFRVKLHWKVWNIVSHTKAHVFGTQKYYNYFVTAKLGDNETTNFLLDSLFRLWNEKAEKAHEKSI